MTKIRKVQIVLILIIVALISFTRVVPHSVNPEVHSATTEQIDKEIDSVLKLTAGAAGASAVISLLPDDQCTPIANELAEMAKYFLVVLSALYLEKYLVTVIGYVSFGVLIPVACLLIGVGVVAHKRMLKTVAAKLAILAVALYIMVPLSVKASQLIYDNYSNTLEATVSEANRISIGENTEDSTVVEKFLNWISNAAVTVTEYVTNLLSEFVNALAVMVVASCLIPTLVVVLFVWLMKLMFNVNIPMSFLPFQAITPVKAVDETLVKKSDEAK